jgi:hypothetical protein
MESVMRTAQQLPAAVSGAEIFQDAVDRLTEKYLSGCL